VTLVPAITVAGVGLPQVSLGLTTIVPQLAVVLLPPQLAFAVTLKEPATGLVQAGSPVKVAVTALLLQRTVGWVIAVPAIPVAAKPVQVSWLVVGVLTTMLPQETVLLPPQFAVADTLYVLAVGLFQVGAPAKVALATLVPLH
jgi:hypothetical protein